MRAPHVILVLASAGAALTVVATARGRAIVAPQSPACDVRAYVTDPDPAGLNVRSAPGSTSPVVGRIPKQHAGTVVRVVEARRGWLRIDGAEVIPEDDSPVQPVTERGWVWGRLLAVSAQGNAYGRAGGGLYLYAAPTTSAARLHRLADGSPVLGILDCEGRWARVEVSAPSDRRAVGWLHPNDQCGSPVTECS